MLICIFLFLEYICLAVAAQPYAELIPHIFFLNHILDYFYLGKYVNLRKQKTEKNLDSKILNLKLSLAVPLQE